MKNVVEKDINGYEYLRIMEHIEVYKDNKFVVSADNISEAKSEIEVIGV